MVQIWSTHTVHAVTHTQFFLKRHINSYMKCRPVYLYIIYILFKKSLFSQPNPSNAKLPTSRLIIIWGISKKNSLFTDECWSVSVGSKMSFLVSLFLFFKLLDGNPGYRLSVLRKRNMYRSQANNTYNWVTLCFWNLWILDILCDSHWLGEKLEVCQN